MAVAYFVRIILNFSFEGALLVLVHRAVFVLRGLSLWEFWSERFKGNFLSILTYDLISVRRFNRIQHAHTFDS
jgi:hypothetical protein